MIAVDTSVILAIALNEPEAELLKPLVDREPVIVGWPTLFETRMVLTGKEFPSSARIVAALAETPNVTTVAFDRFGKRRHLAALNMGDCFSYAVAAIAGAPLLFKGRDFGKMDVNRHPASSDS